MLRSDYLWILVALVVLSIASTLISFHYGYNIVYNDAMSHLNIARMVFDNIEPGFAQLGSVWLPFNHVLYLPFIANDWAWHSGFAGSIVSMVSYVIAGIYVYKTMRLLTGVRYAVLVGVGIFALNLNNLYLQTTSLTETPYLALVAASFYFFIRYFQTLKLHFLIALGFLGFLQIITRYDGWFVVAVQGAAIFFFLLWKNGGHWLKALGRTTLYIYPIVFAVFIWLLWNLLLYHDPLYFILGPYSAHSQQEYIESVSGLSTKYNMWLSLKAFYYTWVDNVGVFVFLVSIVGSVYFFLHQVKSSATAKWLKLAYIVVIASPILFNILALFLGFSIVSIRDINPSTVGGAINLFNVRYGVMALPFTAIFAGYLASYGKKTAIAVALIAIVQGAFMYNSGIVTLVDGQKGSSSFVGYDMAQALKERVGAGEKVLLSTSFYNAVAFKSNLQLKQIVHEGVSREWKPALVEPENYVDWIVAANGDVGEPVYTSLVKNHGALFLKDYKMVYQATYANLYRLRTDSERFVTAQETGIMLGKKKLDIQGVNAYDLAYRSHEEIDSSLEQLSSLGVHHVRVWAFGEGSSDSFQPQAGQFSEERLENLDYVVYKAKQLDMRLILTTLNNWDDYGGKNQYVRWVGKQELGNDIFYSNGDAKNLYKNYLNTLLSRVNSYTKVSYAEETAVEAWDLMNEPRLEQSANTQTLLAWAAEMTAYVRERDPNHMLTFGSDAKELEGTNSLFGELCATEGVSFCSLHLYPFENGSASFGSLSEVQAFIERAAAQAANIHKPYIITEVGMQKNEILFGQNSMDFLKNVKRSMHEAGGSGMLVWNWSLRYENSFGFSPQEVQGSLHTPQNLRDILFN